MNDIFLTPTDPAHYDWSFKNRQIENVQGAQQIISAVRHAILLRKNELTQFLYAGQGNNLYDFVKLPATDETQKLIINEIRGICKTIPAVKDAKVEIEKKDNNVFITKITVEQINGGLIEIGI